MGMELKLHCSAMIFCLWKNLQFVILRNSKGENLHGEFIGKTLIPWLQETGVTEIQR